MKGISVIMAIGFVFLAAGCGSSNESHSKATTTYQINGKTPEEYFRQFVYRETGTCGTIHEAHHFAESETFKIGVNGAGKDVLATLAILMRDNGTYAAFYQEVVVLRYVDSGYYWDSHQEQVVRGNWAVNGEWLVLSGLGIANALQYNGAPAMQLQAANNLLSNGLKGRVLLVRRVEASYNPVPETNPCAGK